MTVFLTTHYMEEAAGADQIVVLEKGRICAEGSPVTLKSRYGKDMLKLRFADMEMGRKELAEMGCGPIQKGDSFIIPVENSKTALRIVNGLHDFLDFELVKGTMDDVFLAVTGQKEVPQV